MNALDFIHSSIVFVEIGQSSLKVLEGDAGLELRLERAENGRLTHACREEVRAGMRDFLKARGWRLRPRAFCAIGARGVSLRRLTLPAASREELHRLLPLQIESEFPLPPDQLAWGYLPINAARLPGSDERAARPVVPSNEPTRGAPALQEVLVVAVKRETLEEYSQLLSACGLTPVFTLGAMARGYLCRSASGSYAMLDIGWKTSELVSFDQGVPGSMRVLQWGGEDITRAIEKRLGVSREEAERLKIQLTQTSVPPAEIGPAIQAELDRLAELIDGKPVGQTLYLTGGGARLKDLAPQLAAAIGDGANCERIEIAAGEGRSAANLGLKASMGANGEFPLLMLQAARTKGAESLAPAAMWKWAALAAGLALSCLVLRYAEPILFKPRLAKRIAEVNAYRKKLPQIDRELIFLQYFKTNQPPHLDTLTLIANSAPGARLESFTLNRRGDVSLRAAMRDAQQVTEFRSKLIESGFFSSVTVEEQTPSANDRQKISARISGQLKPTNERKPLSIGSTPKESEKSKASDAKPSASTNLPSTAFKGAAPLPSPPTVKE